MLQRALCHICWSYLLPRRVDGTFSGAKNWKHTVYQLKKGSQFLPMLRCMKCQLASISMPTIQASPLVLHMELMIVGKPAMKAEWAVRTRAVDDIWHFLCHMPVGSYSTHSHFSQILWPINYIQLNIPGGKLPLSTFLYTILESNHARKHSILMIWVVGTWKSLTETVQGCNWQ